MELLVKRASPIPPNAIPGEMFIGPTHACYTLERQGVEIPAGRYAITLYPSPHFGRVMPLLNDVPNRSMIEIHWGNVPGASDGCIIVGEMQDASTGDVFSSRKAFDALFPAIEAAVEAEGCWITVQ